jgi:WD40 repeat protein
MLTILAIAGPIQAEPSAKVRADRYGDLLPTGALVRLGTVRWRNQGRSFAFSPDGKRIASSGFDGSLRIRDAATGAEHRRLVEERAVGCGRIAYSPDGKLLAAEDDQAIRLWDTARGKCIRKLPRAKRNQFEDLVGLAFSPDGKLLAAGEETGGITLWDARTGVRGEQIDPREEKLHAFAFLPEDNRLLTVNRDGVAGVWEMDGRRRRTFRIDPQSGFSSAISTDGKTLIVGIDRPAPPGGKELLAPGLTSVWDITTGKERWRLETQGSVIGVALSPDGKTLAYIQDTANVIQLRDMDSWKELRRLAVVEGIARNLTFSPDGKVLAARVENSLELWDVATGRSLSSRPGHAAAVGRVAFTANGRQLVSISRNQQLGTARVWDALTGQYLYMLPEDWNWTDAGVLCASPDAKMLLLGDFDAITVWDVAARRSVRRLPIEKKPAPNSSQQILALALSPDGRRITSISVDGDGRTTFLVCDAVSGADLSRRVLVLREGRITPLPLFLNGRFAATTDGRTVWFRDVVSGVVRQTFYMEKPADDEVLSGRLTFSNDGRLLACISRPERTYRKGKVRLWEVATGAELPPFLAPYVQAIAFAPDGRTLAMGDEAGDPSSEEGSIRLRDIATGKEVGRCEGHGTIVGTSYLDPGGGALAFSPDGQTLATGLMDSTVLLWDVKPALRRVKEALPAVREQDLPRLWADLAGADARKAQASIWALAAAPKIALPFLEQRLTPARSADAERLRRLIADLDSEQFPVRKAASEELRKFDLLAEPALQKALKGKPSLESRRRIEELLAFYRGPVVSDETRRIVRAVTVLEYMKNEEASRLLKKLSAGTPEARLTREATAALERIRSPNP